MNTTVYLTSLQFFTCSVCLVTGQTQLYFAFSELCLHWGFFLHYFPLRSKKHHATPKRLLLNSQLQSSLCTCFARPAVCTGYRTALRSFVLRSLQVITLFFFYEYIFLRISRLKYAKF